MSQNRSSRQTGKRQRKQRLSRHPNSTNRSVRFESTPRLEALEDRRMLAPVPVVNLSAPAESMIGEDGSFTATFDNQATGAPSVGYGPYVNLFVDNTGADGVFPGSAEPNDFDGLSILSATYLGATITPTIVTLGPGGSYTHPIATDATGTPLTGTAPAGFTQGDSMYVYELPFGSFTDGQTPAELELQTNVSSEADLDVPLQIAAQGGFRYGADPLDNPATDTGIVGAIQNANTVPKILRLFKEYNGPEDETATGPNFPRTYTLYADVADGQTIADLRLIDFLPNDLAFLNVVSTSAGGIVEQTPTIGTPDVAPNNDLVVRFPSVTGGTGDNDVEVVFQYFAPDLDASGQDVLDPITGNDVPTTNDGRVTGSWTPTDPSDSVAAINVVDQSSLTDNHVLDLKSIAIQKSSQIINDVGMVGVSPGDTVEYTLQFQISDYFTFGDLIIEDILSDGQRLTGSPTGPFTDPFTLDVTDRNGNVTGSFSPSLTNGATNLFVDLSQIGNDTNPATDGSTRLVFDVSRALTDLGAADGILQGGRAILPDAGGATGVITYRTVIQQSFSDTYPSGESNVDQGDILENNVTISGTIRSNSAIATNIGVEEDTSAEVLEVLGGQVIKTTYAVNGTLGPVDATVDPDTGLVRGPSYANTLQVRPGDVVTYRLRYAMPSADVENLLITDFLPLPVYDATIISTTFGTTVDGTAPSADSAKYGPDHTFSRVPLSGPPTQHPTMTTSAVDNNVVFDFGSFNEPPPEGPRVVDILLSVTISDEPMADGLLLTNQFEASHGTTNAGTLASDSITQITLTEPELAIRKAAVSSDNSNATFSSTVAPTGISFEAPGLNTPANSFVGGTIHSTNLGNTINSNISRVDADDLVKFAIVVENTGSSSAGAFDVAIRDTLPAGFAIPATGPGLNLELFDGAGNAMPFTSLGSGLFDPAGGIQLNDPGATPATSIGSPPVTVNAGALDEFDPTDGNNILVLTYDLQVVANVAPGQTANLQNTATVFNYAGSEGGPDHTNPTDLTDTAQTTIGVPVVSKQLIDTSMVNANNANNQAVIGEIVTYELQVTIPEGSTPNAVIQDTLDSGLAFVDVLSFSSSPALTIANPIGTGTAPANTTVTNSGGTLAFNLGNVTNSDRTNTTPETITIRYRAVVLNESSNQSAPATALNNSARIIWTGGSVARVGAPTVSVIEPLLDVNKTVSSATADAFNSLRYTVTVSHLPGSTDAYDVSLSDVLPAGLNYVANSWVHTGGVAPDSIADTAGTLSTSWNTFALGSTSTFQFDVTVSGSVSAGQSIVNSANATWTSLPGATASDLSVYNSNSRERTGAGGTNDYADTGFAIVTISVPTAKTIVSTSEATTAGANVAIGEIVRYHISAQIPESTATNFQIVDQLPNGLQFLDDGTATVALVSNGTGLTSSTLAASFEITGSSSSITPLATLPGSAISGGPFSSGTDVTFSLGNLTNADNDADSEFAIIEFNAIVVNNATTNAGTDLDNTFLVRVNGSQVGPVSPSVQVTVVEPSISDVNKTVLTPASARVDAGQTVRYQVTYSNANTLTSNDAFNVRLLDNLPANLQGINNVQVLRNGSTITSGFTNVSSSTTLDVTLDQVAPADVITIRYDVQVTNAAPAGAAITNQANVTYTSLPGTNGTTSNPTGSSTGAAGGLTGERIGSGGVNDYADSDQATVNVQTHTISGFVYHDQNNNGVFDEAATNGIGNVTVQLTGTDHLGNTVSLSQLTNGTGAYSFTNLRPGMYTVTELQPSGYFNGRDSIGSPTHGGTNANVYDDSLGTYTIATGTVSSTSVNNNFGELLPATIEGIVYVDANNNGLFSGETQLPNVPISLSGIDDQGNSVTSNATTSAAGAFSFTNLRPGTYSVSETTQPAAYVDGLETRGNSVPLVGSAGGNDTINSISVLSGQTASGNNFGEVPPSTIQGRIFADGNNDGVANNGDTGLAGITVNLSGTDVFGNPVSETTSTDTNGNYSFDFLMAGNYVVTEPTQPASYFDGFESRSNVALPGTVGSDVITGIVLGVGQTSTGNNFAEVPDVMPQGFVFIDANNNGVKDPGEPGVSGVQVNLTGVGNDVFGNPIPSRTEFTDSQGFYQFTSVPPGTYTITEVQPAGFQDGQEQNGTPAAASVINDSFVAIPLINTPAGGDYNFGELSPSGSVSGSVYVDANNNGIREPGELGLGGVVITLINQNNPTLTYQVTTDATGHYQFVKMFPGQYQIVQGQPVNFLDGRETLGTSGGLIGQNDFTSVTVGVNQAATGYLFGEVGINPALISKRMFLTSANPNTDFTGPAGTGIAAVNAALSDPAGYVYVDENENGQRDEGEPGIPNVQITLTGTTPAVSHIQYETFTDSNGFYQFAFLPTGVYSLFETQPEGYDDGQESLGSLGGIVGQDSFSQIVLNAGDFGVDYNFGELRREPEYITGDSNHDGIFNSTDLMVVFQAGEYEDGVANNSTFEEGDWNGDGDFTSSDLVLALQAGTFVPTALDDDE